MCRSCLVPGCEVLLITSAPMCGAHWGRLPEKVKDALGIAEDRLAGARTEEARLIASAERQAAMDMAVAYAAKKPAKNMGKGSLGYPSGPVAG